MPRPRCRDFLKVAGFAGSQLADAVGSSAGPRRREGRQTPAGPVDHPACGCKADPASWRRSTRIPAPPSPAAPGHRHRRSRTFNWPTASDISPRRWLPWRWCARMMSKEGDHERGTYLMKTGYPPRSRRWCIRRSARCAATNCPAARRTFRGTSRSCPSQWPGRGGFLGDEYDAFKTGDPIDKVPNVTARVAGRTRSAALEGPRLARRASSPRAGSFAEAAGNRTVIGNARTDDVVGAAQGVRRGEGAGAAARQLRRHAVRPRLPGGAATDRGRRPLRRSDARPAGTRTPTTTNTARNRPPSSTRRSPPCCATCANAKSAGPHGRDLCRASSAGRRRSTDGRPRSLADGIQHCAGRRRHSRRAGDRGDRSGGERRSRPIP